MGEDAQTLIARVLMVALTLAVIAPIASADPQMEALLRRGLADLEKAQAAYTNGQREAQGKLARRALDTFTIARKHEPRDLRVWFFGTQAAAFSGDQAQAIDWYNGYRSRTPRGINDPDLHFLQAFVYIFAGDNPDRAVEALTRMQAIDARRRAVPRDTLAYIARLRWGNALVNREDYHGAVKQFNEAARLSRRRGWLAKELAALGNSGIALNLASEWKRAEEVFDDLIARDGENALWHWHKGLVIGSQNNFADAIPYYRKVVELREAGKVGPAHKEELDRVYLRLGNCLRNVGGQIVRDVERRKTMLAEAEKHLRKYTEVQPKDHRGFRWLGEMYFNDLERPYDAIRAYAKAYELDWACGDVPLRSLVQLYQRNPPAPGPEPEAERKTKWAKRLAELIKLRDEEAVKRSKEIERRRKLGATEDTCD